MRSSIQTGFDWTGFSLSGPVRHKDRKAALPAGGRILGESAVIRELLNQLALVAPTGASVLILGESGTGKELVAREIHDRSLRQGRPLITVNCASIPRELFESEFFGHLKDHF